MNMMKTETAHAPTPRYPLPNKLELFAPGQITLENGLTVNTMVVTDADSYGGTKDEVLHVMWHDEDLANEQLADRILTRYNNHAALVATLATLVNLYDGLEDGGDGITPDDWAYARALLAQLDAGKTETDAQADTDYWGLPYREPKGRLDK